MNWTIKDLGLWRYLRPEVSHKTRSISCSRPWRIASARTVTCISTGGNRSGNWRKPFKQYPLLHGLLKPQVSSAFILPVAGLGFDPSPTTISEPVLSAQTSNCSLAAALKVSPAAMSTFNETTSHYNVVTHPVILEQDPKRNFLYRWKWLHYSTKLHSKLPKETQTREN